MNKILRIACGMLAIASFSQIDAAHAQSRAVGARSLILDDGTSNTITLQTPVGGWSGNFNWYIPVPPIAGATSGFVYPGGTLNDMLTWLPATQTYNNGITTYYGGTSGSWVPKTASSLGFISVGTAAGGDLTGTYPNPTIANNAVTSAKIFDGTIVNADISGSAAIAYSKLALNNSILNTDLAGSIAYSKLILTNSIVSGDISDGTIMDADVNAAAGIQYSKLSGTPTSLPPSGAAGGDLTGTFPNPTVANNAITSAKIFDGTIVNADISGAAAISYSKLSLAGTLLGTDVAAGTFAMNNANLAIGNSDNTARELRFVEPSGSGSNYSAFKAQAQAGDLTYTLPSTAPGAPGQFLSVQSVVGNNATLQWAGVGGGAIAFSRVTATAGATAVAASTDIVGAKTATGAITLNFPSAATAGAGHIILVKDEDFNASTNNITINAAGGETVEDNSVPGMVASFSVSFPDGAYLRFYSDGVNKWYQW
jgi:hypothetical protein